MSARQEDFVFAEHVLRRGFATEEQVQECLDLLERLRGEMSLEETLEGILLKRGYLAPAQAQVIRQAINPEQAGRSRNQIEGYRLLARLGSGAMGSVYKARHDKLDILVALKVLRVELAKSKTQVERLKREAQLAARLNHPNIVRSLDVGESNGFHYFAMEFVDGPTARNLIRESRMKEKDALRIITAVARALEHAHQNGIIHRDVKPANIMLSRSGQVKLGDFGLARGQGPSELTLEHAAIGTPQYLAPEQAASAANATPRSDLFSLGATLYHLVTGQPPFSGDNLAEIFGRVIRADFDPPESVVDDLSIDTVYLIHKLMRPNPKDRYANATELLADLEKAERGERVAPSDFKGDYRSFLDRRRQKRSAIAAAAVAIIVASAWFTWSTIERHQQRADALAQCRVLNDRGAGELDALGTLEGLRQKRDELERARSGLACDESVIRDLIGRIDVLNADLERLEQAEQVLVRARKPGAEYRRLLSEVEAIRPQLEGAAARRRFILGEVRRLSDEEARVRYKEVYVHHPDVSTAIRSLQAFAEELRTRFADLEDISASTVASHARDLESLNLAYEKARADHGPRFDAAVKSKNFDTARFQLDKMHEDWRTAYDRRQHLPADFLGLFPAADEERSRQLAEKEEALWSEVLESAAAEEKGGRPDQAIAIVRRFKSGAEKYRQKAAAEIERLQGRVAKIQEDQGRAVDELEQTFRSALGDRRYAAAVELVRRRAGEFAWFGEGARRYQAMQERAAAIDRDLVEKFLPRLRELDSVDVESITGNPRRKTAPGTAFSRAPGTNRDQYVLRLGEEEWTFGLEKLDFKTLKQVFRVETAKGDERLAAAYFLLAESFGHEDDPLAAQSILFTLKRSLGSLPGDPWLHDVTRELERLGERIQEGENRARTLHQFMNEAVNRNRHERALKLCESLLENYGWTSLLTSKEKGIQQDLETERKRLQALVGAVSLAKDSGIPPAQFEQPGDGPTRITYTGAPYHPLAEDVPPDAKDPETWIREREESLYRILYEKQPKARRKEEPFPRFFHRAIHQLLDWSGPVDVKKPGAEDPLNPPGYVLQVKDPSEPDERWWQGTLDEKELTVGLRNHFDPEGDWSLEFTVEWPVSTWSEKEYSALEKRAVAQRHRARIPVYFVVAAGHAQGAIGYFPKKNGGVAGTRIFLDEKLAPPDAHAREFDDFHWHMAEENARSKTGPSDRAWLGGRNWKVDVPYRVRFERIRNELHLWMAPLDAWQKAGGFVGDGRSLDDWKKGKVSDVAHAVHIWAKKRSRELDKAAAPEGEAPRFRFFGRVRFTLRDVVAAGRLRQRNDVQ